MRRFFTSIALFFSCVSLLCAAALADDSSINYQAITVRGIHLGMDAKTAYSVLVKAYGKPNVTVTHTTCSVTNERRATSSYHPNPAKICFTMR